MGPENVRRCRRFSCCGIEDEFVDTADNLISAVHELPGDGGTKFWQPRFKPREVRRCGPGIGAEIAVAKFADLPGIEVLLKVHGDRQTEQRLAKVQRFTNKIVAGSRDGIGATGEIVEDGAWVKWFKREIAGGGRAAGAVDNDRSRELPERVEQRREGRRGLVRENVVARLR